MLNKEEEAIETPKWCPLYSVFVMKDKKCKKTVVVYINLLSGVVEACVKENHGNSHMVGSSGGMEEAMIKTIKKASHVPKPPKTFKIKVAKDGLSIDVSVAWPRMMLDHNQLHAK